MTVTDLDLALLNECVYYDREPSGRVSNFARHKRRDGSHGFVAETFIRECNDKTEMVYVFRGTHLGAGQAVDQLRSDWGLTQDPDENMGILEEASTFVEDTQRDVNRPGMSCYSTGHSLGGLSAMAMVIQYEDLFVRCVTFDTPGIIQYWRKKACDEGEERWKDTIHNYLSYPNLINTALPKIGRNVRMEMNIHTRFTAGHAARCVLGTAMRAVIWMSLGNAASAFAGRSKGFWLSKAVAAGGRVLSLALRRILHPGRMLKESRAAIKKDQAKADALEAEKTGSTADERSSALNPLLVLLPVGARSGLIVGFWAMVTVTAATLGYIVNRTGGNLKDCADEHNIHCFIDGFDERTGEPLRAIEMAKWPHHRHLLDKGFNILHSRRLLQEALLPLMPTSYGIHNILSRKKLLLRRARSLPGYQEIAPIGIENSSRSPDQAQSYDQGCAPVGAV